jgi:hypothetical protein
MQRGDGHSRAALRVFAEGGWWVMRWYKHNGEHWYADDRSLWKRLRQWVVWFGGWERPNGGGWSFRGGPTPVSLFGHRLTLHGHWFDVRTPAGYLVVDVRERTAYVSPNGTPRHAHTWIRGAPHDVVAAAEARHG